MMSDLEALLWLLAVLTVCGFALYGTGIAVLGLLEWIGAF